MNLIGTKNVTNSKRIYHKEGCIYAKRIKEANAKYMTVKANKGNEICKCAYCSGLKGELRLNKKSINKRLTKTTELHYEAATDTLYVSTDIGFWKIFYKAELGKYLLCHRNTYNKNMSLKTAMYGDFHRQWDASPNEHILGLINYIIAHDNAKKIIAIDYKKLPQDTKKQKKYYFKAAKREKRNTAKRLDNIFLMLEQQNQGFKQLSYC